MTLNRRTFISVTIGTLLLGCGKTPHYSKIPSNGKVIALGDSLTFGYGVTPETAYPSVLAAKTNWQVINEGINGDTSAGVLARLEGILQLTPQLILLGIGGNDVLQRIAPVTTKTNISQIVDKIKSASVPVVLIAEPYFSNSALFGKASDNPIYAEIAKEKDILLFAKSDGGWSDILSDTALKSDQIHANAQGYAKFADNLFQFLQKHGFI